MRATGIVRKLDPLGRIVIPAETRKTLGLAAGDAMEIFTDDDSGIVLRKYERGCVLCGHMGTAPSPLVDHEGLLLCEDCLRGLCQAFQQLLEQRTKVKVTRMMERELDEG